MDNKDKKEEKVMGVLGIIALRKSGIYNKIVNELEKKEKLSEQNKNEIQQYISSMGNKLFLTENEKKNKRINPALTASDLNLDVNKIIEGSLR